MCMFVSTFVYKPREDGVLQHSSEYCMYTHQHVNILHRYDCMVIIYVSVYAMWIFYVYILVSTFTYKPHGDGVVYNSRE